MSVNIKQQQRRPLLWTCLSFTTFGLLCSLVSLVLPYWYARYPQSKSRFVRLGLWEICFEDFMPADLGNLMYDGCFYLYDPKISALLSLIFRTWFVVCQAFQTFGFVAYVLVEVVLITQACNLVSSRGPRAVFFSIIASGATFLFVLISSVTMGTGVDAESKRKPAAEQDWLISLDQCSLSWAYGIAVLSLLGCLVPFVILCWCVYPKRSTSGLLSVSAWDWPDRNDLICRYHLNDLRTLSSQSQSVRSRSMVSGDLGSARPYSHSSLSGQMPHRTTTSTSTTRDVPYPAKPFTVSADVVKAVPLTSYQSRSRHSRSSSASNNRRAPRVPESVSQASFDGNGKLSSYDPRSPDSISLLSYERNTAPMTAPKRHIPSNTASEQSSILTQESSTRMCRPGNHTPRGDRRELYEFDSPEHLSAATLTMEAATESVHLSTGRPSRLRSAASGMDTSVWTADSSIQAARPMGRSRSKSNLKQTSQRSGSPTPSEPPTPEELTPRPVVQVAKPMRRKHH